MKIMQMKKNDVIVNFIQLNFRRFNMARPKKIEVKEEVKYREPQMTSAQHLKMAAHHARQAVNAAKTKYKK